MFYRGWLNLQMYKLLTGTNRFFNISKTPLILTIVAHIGCISPFILIQPQPFYNVLPCRYEMHRKQ